jgi:peroxiredoxin family protein
MRDPGWLYTVRGYASNQHPKYPEVKYGDLLLETKHATKASADLEVSVWKSRMKRGGVAYIEVISHVEPYDKVTIYDCDYIPRVR